MYFLSVTKILESAPAVFLTFFRENPLVINAQKACPVFLCCLHVVQLFYKEQVCKLLDYFQWIRNASGPEHFPYFIDFISQFS